MKKIIVSLLTIAIGFVFIGCDIGTIFDSGSKTPLEGKWLGEEGTWLGESIRMWEFKDDVFSLKIINQENSTYDFGGTFEYFPEGTYEFNSWTPKEAIIALDVTWAASTTRSLGRYHAVIISLDNKILVVRDDWSTQEGPYTYFKQ